MKRIHCNCNIAPLKINTTPHTFFAVRSFGTFVMWGKSKNIFGMSYIYAGSIPNFFSFTFFVESKNIPFHIRYTQATKKKCDDEEVGWKKWNNGLHQNVEVKRLAIFLESIWMYFVDYFGGKLKMKAYRWFIFFWTFFFLFIDLALNANKFFLG